MGERGNRRRTAWAEELGERQSSLGVGISAELGRGGGAARREAAAGGTQPVTRSSLHVKGEFGAW